MEEPSKETAFGSHSGSAEEREVMDHAFSLRSYEREYKLPQKEDLL